MHRRHLLEILRLYRAAHPEESAVIDAVEAFVGGHPDCFERTCAPGHVTGSAWILSSDHRQVLLTHHRKLGRWLQLGGHADGDSEPLRVAMREAREESGLTRFEPLWLGRDPVPLDVDVHEIPSRGDEPAHLHHDIRYLLVAARGQEIAISDESTDLKWIDRHRLGEIVDEPGQLRMEQKASRILAHRRATVAPESR